MNYKCKNPVLIIAFNRPDLFKKVLDRVIKVSPKKIYVSIDGPRTNNFNQDLNSINEIISIIKKITNIKIKLLKNKFNLGVGRAPHKAISSCFKEEKKMIILEDDCLPSLSFFKFMDDLLAYYEDKKEIFHITGSNILMNSKYINYSYDFSQICQTHGWATWRDRWSNYIFEITDESLFHKKPSFLYSKFLYSKHAKYWHLLFKNILIEKKYNFWDYQLAYLMFKQGLFCIIPKINMIANLGNDFRSSNTKEKFSPTSELKLTSKNIFPLVHPKKIRRNHFLDAKIMDREYTISIFRRIIYKFMNFFYANNKKNI